MMLQTQISEYPRRQAPGLSKRTGGRSVQPKCACGGSGGGASECEACGDKKEKGLQRYSADRKGFTGLAGLVGAAGAMPPQDSSTGSRNVSWGHNFGRVRVHGGDGSRVQRKSDSVSY